MPTILTTAAEAALLLMLLSTYGGSSVWFRNNSKQSRVIHWNFRNIELVLETFFSCLKEKELKTTLSGEKD